MSSADVTSGAVVRPSTSGWSELWRKEDWWAIWIGLGIVLVAYVLRRILNPMGTMDAMDFLLDKLRNTKNNGEFFDSMNT